MRSALLLLSGLVLAGAGVAVLLSDLPGHWWLGIALLVAGILTKTCGFLVGDDPLTPRQGQRRITTLDGQEAERPRAGLPTGRSASLHRRGPHGPPTPARTAQARRPARPDAAPPIRRAS